MNDAEALWRGKTDEEVADAARQLSDYTEEGERLIRGEELRLGEWPSLHRPSGQSTSGVRRP